MPLTFECFRVWEVAVPVRDEIIRASTPNSAIYRDNRTWPQMPIHLVEATTTDGMTAIGECGRGTSRSEVEHTLRVLLNRDLHAVSPPTIWMDTTGGAGLPARYPHWSWQAQSEYSYALMESLWVDAVAKAAGMPAHMLFGGAVREKVTADFWANRPGPQVMAKLVQEARERGLRGMKMKSDSTGDTAQALLAIAADVPDDFRITIDPMLAWRSLRETARLFESLAKLRCIIQIEDPFPYTAVEDWQAARQFSPLTIICHARSENVLRHALREKQADAFNLGGSSLYAFIQMAHVAEFHNKDCWLGSALELGVLQHLRLHAAACVRNCVLASDLSSEWLREHTLVTPRMQYQADGAVVPSAPGLGVELDHTAIENYCLHSFEIT